MIESPHLHDEEQMARLVRSTVQAAGQIDNGRLRQLMPAIPTHRSRPPVWQRQLATACAALLVCLGLFGVYRTSESGAGIAPTYVAITATLPSEATLTSEATFTSEPTATETQTVTSTAVAQPRVAITPAPPTPVAALPLAVNRNP